MVSEPEDLRGRSATTGRSSSPFAMPRYQPADLPKCRCRKASDFARRSAPVSMPSGCILAAVTGPTPWNLAIGSDSTKPGPISGRDDELAIRLAMTGGELGEELVVGDAG